MLSLGSTYANSTNYVGPPNTATRPSLPNYFTMTMGSFPSCATGDGAPSSCSANSTQKSIVDLFSRAGVTWKGYMEDMPSNCYPNDSGIYEVHHDPFPYYPLDASTCSTNDVRSGSSNGGTSCTSTLTTSMISTLINDLNGTSPNFAWVTPNLFDDVHNCTPVTHASAWLNVMIPAILTTNTFKNDPTATIAAAFDEPSSGTYGVTPVWFIVAGPGAKTHYTSTIKYSHLNLLRTIENNWGLGCLTNECGTATMGEFFKQTVTVGLASPPPVVPNQNY